MSSNVKNAKQFPKVFYCRHMLPGIARYENYNRETGAMEEEYLFIDADAMKQAAPSLVGKPVYVHHQKVDLENIENADGFVSDCFYNELDGWLWAKFLAVSDESQTAVANNWSVSNAYLPIEWTDGGQHLNIDYDRKIRNHEFTHLAIVPNPRYEEAKIYTPEEYKAYQAGKRSQLEELQNSKTNHLESSLMFFRTKKEEIKAGESILDSDFTEIRNDDGSVDIITVAELKEAKRLEKLNAKKNEKMVGDDEEVDVDGEKVNMSDLKECYKNMKKVKKNDDEAEKEKAEKEKKEKENAEKEKEKEEKENAKRLLEIVNAHNKVKSAPVETVLDKKRRGSELFGSGKK